MDEQLHFCMHVITTATSLSKPFKTWNDEIYNPSQRGKKNQRIHNVYAAFDHEKHICNYSLPRRKNTLKLSSPKGMIKISQNK